MKITDTNETPLLSGKKAFELIDSIGFPYELLVIELQERGAALDTIEFMKCALNSKNFSKKRLKNMMLGGSSMTEEMFDKCIEHIEKGGKGIL